MFKKEMKLPETKHLLEVDYDFKKIICFFQSGSYQGDILNEIEYIEEIIEKYKGRTLFNRSQIFESLEYFISNISFYAHHGYVKLSEEELEGFRHIAREIIKEYNILMSNYKENY